MSVEPLESRRLLAGIHVSVYVDQNGSRGYDSAIDAPAIDRLVYVDLNHDGSFNRGEPIEVTDADGHAFFEELAAGDYAVGLLTSSNSQAQVEPTSVAHQPLSHTDVSTEQLVHSAEFEHVWSVNATGKATRISAGDASSVELGAAVSASLLRNDGSAWLVVGEPGTQRLTEFEGQSGEFTSLAIDGLAADETIVDLTESQSNVVALVNGAQGNSLVKLFKDGSSAYVSQRTPTFATKILASTATETVVLIGQHGGTTSIELLDLTMGLSNPVNLTLPMPTSTASLSVDGGMLLLDTPSGVRAYTVKPTGVTLSALLAEAAGPLAADSIDGRIVTSSATDAQELIVWDSATWTPIGRSRLTMAAAAAIQVSRSGDRAIAYGPAGVETVRLAVARTSRVTVAENGNATVRLGVQTRAPNTAPDVTQFNRHRTLAEDTADALDWTNGIQDPDGDTLWYTLHTAASHGQLKVDALGAWTYQPHADFNGSDSAVIRVHDGLTTTELRINWLVAPVNDPPSSISVSLEALAENSAVGQASVLYRS
ncbi:MAG: Ig-like domain-containing protein [Pirellulaceae bacterium]